jgi:hypothetical protein
LKTCWTKKEHHPISMGITQSLIHNGNGR